MNKEIVTVDFVNQPKPGKKMGSIKASDGRYFSVWPDKLSGFQKGGRYEIEYDSTPLNGKTFHNVKSFKAVDQSPAPTGNGTNGSGHGQSKDAEIRWQVCLKVAGQVFSGREVTASALLGFAKELHVAEPSAVEQDEEAPF